MMTNHFRIALGLMFAHQSEISLDGPRSICDSTRFAIAPIYACRTFGTRLGLNYWSKPCASEAIRVLCKMVYTVVHHQQLLR